MNRVALITGSAKRVGASIARSLHANDFNIVIHHNTSTNSAEELQRELSGRRSNSATCVRADLADLTACRMLIENAVDAWGQLDLLVNNASIYAPTPLMQLDEWDFAEIIDVNLRAPLFLAKYAAPALAKCGGAIVNISDIYADRPNQDHPIYLASKAGLSMLTKSLAFDLAPDIRVNAVAPGAVLWPEDDDDSERKQKILARIPSGKIGDPNDVAEAVLYFATARYVTGQILAIDGGRSLTI